MRASAGKAVAARPDAATIASSNTPPRTNDATTEPGYPGPAGTAGVCLPAAARLTVFTYRVGQPEGEGGPMPDFMDEAKKLASEHSDVADQGLDQAAEQTKEKTGGRFDSQIEGGEQQAEGFLGVQDQDSQDANQQDANQQDANQ
jgi:hypothetical protein